MDVRPGLFTSVCVQDSVIGGGYFKEGRAAVFRRVIGCFQFELNTACLVERVRFVAVVHRELPLEEGSKATYPQRCVKVHVAWGVCVVELSRFRRVVGLTCVCPHRRSRPYLSNLLRYRLASTRFSRLVPGSFYYRFAFFRLLRGADLVVLVRAYFYVFRSWLGGNLGHFVAVCIDGSAPGVGCGILCRGAQYCVRNGSGPCLPVGRYVDT